MINDVSEMYVVAELGHNHGGDLETAKCMIKKAKEAGADAVKLQKRNNKSLYTKAMYEMPYENESSYGRTYGEHREALEFDWEDYKELQFYAKKIGITFFATAFDEDSAEFLNDLDVPCFKVASADIKNTPLLEKIARYRKPILLSTGGAILDDILRALDVIEAHTEKVILLQCTGSYPVKFEEMDLRVIETFRKSFPYLIGLSDHYPSITFAGAAYVLGARVIEKHFTLNRAMKGTDHAFSLEPHALAKMVKDLKRLKMALGDGIKKTYPSEDKPIYKMAKGTYAARDLLAGDRLGKADIVLKSPAQGFPPYYVPRLIGTCLKKNLAFETPITADVLEAEP